MSSSPIAPDSPLTPAKKTKAVVVAEQQQSTEEAMNKEVGISVREAKIDPVRLVKSMASSKARPKKRDVLPPPVQMEQNTTTDDSSSSTDSTTTDNDPHTDAIQFELNISFNGRTYTATRTLPRIIQLRNDLITEIGSRRKALQEKRKQWLRRSKRRHNNNNIGCTKVSETTTTTFENDDDDVTVNTAVDDDDDDVCTIIPEIPEYYSEERGNFAGRGFTLLHALMRSYCPAMEGWLRKVTDLVPDSPSLSNFLWEPVSGMATTRHCSFNTLVSIKEDDSEEEEDDDDIIPFVSM